MTIIRPNQNQDLKRLAIILRSVFIAVFLIGVFVYVNKVTLKHDVAKTQTNIERMKVENAELKNRYYEMLDAGNLERVAGELGLVQDKNPQWVFASHF